MHVGQIVTADCANGIGIRLSLFVSGCTNRCKGCFQPQTWDFEYGVPYTEEMENRILEELKNDYYDGITILGGEPMEFKNQPQVCALLEKIKKTMPQKTVWVYTGFTYDTDLIDGGKRCGEHTKRLLSCVDVLVDGRFEIERKDISLKFRGSANQRLINMKATLKNNRVTLLDI